MPAAPMTIPADPGRPCIRLPSHVLGAVMVGAILVPPVAGLVRTGGFRAVLPGCVQAFLLAGVLLFYIRHLYPGRTRLVVDADGLELQQPFTTWRVRWDEITGTTVMTPYDMTHRGGIAAGVRLRLADGSTRHIPDVLRMRRGELARLIEARGTPLPLRAPTRQEGNSER